MTKSSSQPTKKKTTPKKAGQKLRVGWREWASLPELKIPHILVKVDTGARTSALHAFNVRPYSRKDKDFISFKIHPFQKNDSYSRSCRAELIGQKVVKSSNGLKETRYVIRSPIQIGDKTWPINITLTNRDIMNYRMLLGREAMGHLIVEPSRSFRQGKR